MDHRKLRVEEMGRLTVEDFKDIPKRPITVILDQVRSMHNVGAVFRTSDAFLLEKVYLCGITPSPPHREIRKTAIGAEESMSWEKVPSALDLIKKLKNEGHTIIAVEQTENSLEINEFHPIKQPYAIVFGHEINGVQQEIIDIADVILEIAQFGTKHSLNISVAAGIVLHKISSAFSIDH